MTVIISQCSPVSESCGKVMFQLIQYNKRVRTDIMFVRLNSVVWSTVVLHTTDVGLVLWEASLVCAAASKTLAPDPRPR